MAPLKLVSFDSKADSFRGFPPETQKVFKPHCSGVTHRQLSNYTNPQEILHSPPFIPQVFNTVELPSPENATQIITTV